MQRISDPGTVGRLERSSRRGRQQHPSVVRISLVRVAFQSGRWRDRHVRCEHGADGHVAASIIGGIPTLLPGSLNVGPMSLLSYGTASGDNVTVLVETIPGGVGQAAIQAAIQQAGATGDLQPISGLGDTAGATVTDHEATVAFAKNNTIVVISATVAAMAGTDLEPKVEAVAQQIAGKL